MQFPIIQEHSELKQAVDAKELYLKLGLNFAHWSRWHLMNIAENKFAISGVDFVAFTFMVNGREFDNYLLSIDFAKKIAMQVRTDKGEQVRDYFLECERKAKQAAQPIEPAFQIPQTLGEALQLAANQALQIEHDAPKVNFYNTVAERDNLMTVTQVASKLGMSAQELNKRLVTLGAYDGRIKRCKTFTSEFIAKGYGKMKIGSTGHDQGLITQLGQQWIVGLFNVEVQL